MKLLIKPVFCFSSFQLPSGGAGYMMNNHAAAYGGVPRFPEGFPKISQGWKLLSCSQCQEFKSLPASDWLPYNKEPIRSQVSLLTQLLTLTTTHKFPLLVSCFPAKPAGRAVVADPLKWCTAILKKISKFHISFKFS